MSAYERLGTLMGEAEQSAKSRGHIGTWEVFDSAHARYTCALCGLEVDANAKPMPNEIDIGGEAVALDCTGIEQRVEMFPGPFSVGPRKVYGALCEDGKQRTAACSSKGADTFFSVPARVSAYGRTVSGFVTRDDDVWKFIAYRYGANANVIRRKADEQKETEHRTAPLCGRCGNRGYVTNPPGADVGVEGTNVEACPACGKERTMHGSKLVSEQVRSTVLAYFDRLVADGMPRVDAFIRIGERFNLRSNQIMKLVQEREEFIEQQRRAAA